MENEVDLPSNDNVTENQPPVNETENTLADIDNISDDLIQGMPEVSEHVVEQHQVEQAIIEAENMRATDKRGDSFNPELHATEEDGSPKYTQAGYFAKKRGRKSGSKLASVNNEQPQIDAATIQKQAKQAAAGSAAANSLIMLGVVVGGDEWQPIKNEQHGIDEKRNLETAFADYFAAKDMDDIPAGVALTIAVMGYALPRFTMPQTKQKTGNLLSWAKKKIANWKIERDNKKKQKKHEKDNEDK